MDIKKKFDEVVSKERKNNIQIVEWEADGMCYSELRLIFINEEDFNDPDICSLFTLYHELGHIYNNESWMASCEEEYYATVYAINKFKSIGLTLPDSRKRDYQTYINNHWRENKNDGLKVPYKKDLQFVW